MFFNWNLNEYETANRNQTRGPNEIKYKINELTNQITAIIFNVLNMFFFFFSAIVENCRYSMNETLQLKRQQQITTEELNYFFFIICFIYGFCCSEV